MKTQIFLDTNILQHSSLKSKRKKLNGFSALMEAVKVALRGEKKVTLEDEKLLFDFDVFNYSRSESQKELEALCIKYDILEEVTLAGPVTLSEAYNFIVAWRRSLKHAIHAQISNARNAYIRHLSIEFIKLTRCFYRYPNNDTEGISNVQFINILPYLNLKPYYYEKQQPRNYRWSPKYLNLFEK